MRVNHEFCGHYSCALCVHSSAGQAATGYQRQAYDRACLERARESGAERIIVATDHEDVARAVEAVGGSVHDPRRSPVWYGAPGGSRREMWF